MGRLFLVCCSLLWITLLKAVPQPQVEGRLAWEKVRDWALQGNTSLHYLFTAQPELSAMASIVDCLSNGCVCFLSIPLGGARIADQLTINYDENSRFGFALSAALNRDELLVLIPRYVSSLLYAT